MPLPRPEIRYPITNVNDAKMKETEIILKAGLPMLIMVLLAENNDNKSCGQIIKTHVPIRPIAPAIIQVRILIKLVIRQQMKNNQW